MKNKILSLITALMLTACSLVREPGSDSSGNPTDDITLSFRMLTSATVGGSRADDLHDETDSEFTEFEDGIDASNLGIFIFARGENSTADPVLVFRTTNIKADSESAIIGVPGDYTVTVNLRKGDFERLTGMNITPTGTEKVKFRVLVLANCSSPGTDAAAKWKQLDGTTYSKVIDQASNWAYAMSYLYDNKSTGTSATSIYRRRIPMFGTREYLATQAGLFFSSPEERLDLGEMSLLRAVAKVRVVDNIDNKGADGYPRIIAASIVSSKDMARQLPYGALNYQDGQQVHTTNIYKPDDEMKFDEATVYRLGTIPDSWSMQPGTAKGLTFIGFIPEQKIGFANNDVSKGLPMFHLTMAVEKNPDGTEITREIDVPMTGSDQYSGNKSFPFGTEILRNHIYTLSVTHLTGITTLDVTVTLVPYRGCILKPEFGIDRN